MTFKNNLLLYLTAISPIHSGAKPDIGTVDLPIQREIHTNLPVIYSSSLKGAMREHFRNFYIGEDKDIINEIFGFDIKDKDNSDSENIQPGKIIITDAKLLAFPVRSNIAPFVHVISPYILARFIKDVKLKNIEIPEIKSNFDAIFLKGNLRERKILLEETAVNIVDIKTDILPKEYFKDIDILILVSDYLMRYFVKFCTEIQTNIKIDRDTETAQDGSLRYQEFLPSFTKLYSIIGFLKNKELLNLILDTIKDFIQIGADQSTGKGIFKLKWLNGGENEDN